MIKANELRIGNWVAWDSGATSPDIKRQLKPDDFELAERDGSFNNAEPIPLTPEILEIAGFRHEVHDDVSYYIQSNVWLCHVGDNWYLAERVDNKPFLYLHQLQNLFFALTGTELEIKL